MSAKTTAVNFAHTSGYTNLAFSHDGAFCYTGGDDSCVRIWHTNRGSDQEPDTAVEASDAVMTVASGNDCWFSGSGDSDVRQYKHGKSEFEAIVTGSPAASIRCVAVDPAGKRVAVSSDELFVKVIEIEDVMKISTLHGHEAGVRKVTWHPSGSFLTTCGMDGKIIVWDVSEEEPQELKVLEDIIPAVKDTKSPEFFHDCSAVWHPSGKYFVVANRAHEVVAISRDTWTKTSTFSDEASIGVTTALAFSPNGVYLASSCNKQIFIWSTQTRRMLFTFSDTFNDFVTQIAFSPTTNLLAWTNYDGSLYRWSEPIPSTSPDPVKSTSTTFDTRKIQRQATPTLFGDDITGGVDPQAPDNDEDAAAMDVFDDDNWILDDIDNGMEDDEPVVGTKTSNGFVKEMVSVTKAQPAFQPGSTPFDNKKRYLAYNMVGVIEVTDQDTHNIVDVKFHDSSARKAYHFTDNFKYNLATLGERGAIYACQPENGHPAHIIYKPYGNWADQGEWTYELDEGVRVLGVAAGGPPPTHSLRQLSDGDMQGNGNVVIATSDNDLTFLTGTGIERCSIALDGDFVSMVAGSEWAFVVQRDGATTMDGSQNLTGTLYDFEDLCTLQDRKLPISKGRTLKWIGLSEEGAPAVYDSAGVMYVMPRFRVPLRGTWVRVLDTNKLERKQGKDESYWPIGLSGDTFMCLILKGRQEYPGFPRPLIQELPLRFPFRRKDPKEGPLEEQVARESMYIQITRDALGDELTTDDISRRELGIDKELIQLIQNACKTNKLPRALDLARMLHHTASFDMAIKVAVFYHLPGLQEKMQILKDDREDNDRLTDARDRRKKMSRDYDPVLPPRLPPSRTDAGPSKVKPFQDFGPPPAIHRPNLARATPTVAPLPSQVETHDGWADDHVPMAIPMAVMDGKRKRDDREENLASPEGAKRRAFADPAAELPAPPPKQRTNPFAKKPATDMSRNPFARNADGNKSLHKSDSFFDKVDAAETGISKNKNLPNGGKAIGTKKNTTRQTTLFGLPPPAPVEKSEKRGRKKKALGEDDEGSKSKAGTPDVQAPVSEDVNMDPQATEIDTAQDQEVESQQIETQTMAAESSQTLAQTQVETAGSPEPFDLEIPTSPSLVAAAET